MPRQRLTRPVAGPWYEREDFMQVYRVTQTLLDAWVRIGWVEERYQHGHYAYRTSALTSKIRLLRAVATTADGAVDRFDAQTKELETPARPQRDHGLPAAAGTSLQFRALHDLIAILSEMMARCSEEQRDRLLVTLGMLAGSIGAAAGPNEDVEALLQHLQQLAMQRAATTSDSAQTKRREND